MDEGIAEIAKWLPRGLELKKKVSLANYTTLQSGGVAEWLLEVRRIDDFAEVSVLCQSLGLPHLILGSGSNILPSDKGVPGLTIVNLCSRISLDDEPYAETGCWFQDLFLATAQAGLTGLEFAVGIPGTLGGALVSNAGAYRASIADRLSGIEWVYEGQRQWASIDRLNFSYRDSILRTDNPPPIALLAVRLNLERGDAKHIYNQARDYQQQRIIKQPPHPSAGSFFKNVYNHELANQLPNLPDKMKEAGVVPAGYLIESCGLKGTTIGHAKISELHANFICNLGGASATDIRNLANHAKKTVAEKYGVLLEEEVLYIGDWSFEE